MIKLLLCSIFGSIIFCGCTFEDETAEKIIIPVEEKQDYTNQAEQQFADLAKKCTTGDISVAPKVVHMYMSTLENKDLDEHITLPDLNSDEEIIKADEPYEFQKVKLNSLYEMCIQKASSEGNKEYSNYFISRGITSAKIARHFYANDLITDGAYWCRRATNILGLKSGYYILGRFFTKEDKTFNIGADFLKESAKLGDENAKQYLFDISFNNNVFEKMSSHNDIISE